MFGWNIKDRLPEMQRKINVDKAKQLDNLIKKKGMEYTNNKRKAKSCNIDIGDYVIIKNIIKKNKLTPTFNPQEHEVVRRKGTRLHLKNLETGVVYQRHINHAKKVVCRNPVKSQDLGISITIIHN